MNKFKRVIKEGWQGIKSHSAMTISSVSAVTMTLLIIGVFLLINSNLQHIVDSVEESVQIHAKIEVDVDNDGIKELKNKILELPQVDKVNFSSKDSELQYFIDSYGDQGRLFEMYVGDQNPMRNAFLIEAKDANLIAEIASQVEQMPGIESVNFGGAGTITLVSSMEKVKTTSYIAVIALALVAIFLITNTINATINARADEIYIMRFVGATNSFIRWPFIIEGLIIGLFGSILPILILSGGYYYLYKIMNGHLLTDIFDMVQPSLLVKKIDLILVSCGIIVGIAGSFISVSKRLWGKR